MAMFAAVKQSYYCIIMINISSILHLLRRSWLTDFLVSWVNTLLGMGTQSACSELGAFMIYLRIVSSPMNNRFIFSPPQRRKQWVYTLPDTNWLGWVSPYLLVLREQMRIRDFRAFDWFPGHQESPLKIDTKRSCSWFGNRNGVGRCWWWGIVHAAPYCSEQFGRIPWAWS